MKKITTAKMIEMIRNQNGCTFATIKTNTDPKARKACPVIGLRKKSHMNVMIGFNYENAVNNQRTREEVETEFKSAPRRWGKRVDLKTVEHNDKVYLTTATLNHYETTYEDMNGDTVAKEAIAEFLPKKKEGTRQGTEKKVIYRDFDATNITEITMNGDTFKVY
jgi:hypothetical protein